MSIYAAPGQPDSLVTVQSRYGHFIGGEWVDPIKGDYFENISPVHHRKQEPCLRPPLQPPRTRAAASIR